MSQPGWVGFESLCFGLSVSSAWWPGLLRVLPRFGIPSDGVFGVCLEVLIASSLLLLLTTLQLRMRYHPQNNHWCQNNHLGDTSRCTT